MHTPSTPSATPLRTWPNEAVAAHETDALRQPILGTHAAAATRLVQRLNAARCGQIGGAGRQGATDDRAAALGAGNTPHAFAACPAGLKTRPAPAASGKLRLPPPATACNNGGMAIPINSELVLTPPVPAATVMVLRDASPGLEVLLMRRHAKSGVLGGVHVFPGGKLDAADLTAPPVPLALPPERLAETMAEPGLDAAIAVALYRAALRETLEECGLRLDPATLWPWSRWITPRQPSVTNKRFDTRFFVAPAPAGQDAKHDNHEATEAVWLTPRAGLERYWAGEMDLAPPQIMSLAELARLGSVRQALALARGRPPALIAPESFDEDGCRVICYPGDPRHSVSQPVWPGPTRLTHRNQRFEPEGGLGALLG